MAKIPDIIAGTTDNAFREFLSSTFDPKTIGWWKFEGTLEDEFASNDFISDGGELTEYQKFKQYSLLIGDEVNKQGLIFSSGKTYSSRVGSFLLTSTNYSLNMGFWYYSPSALGFVRNAVTRQSTPKMAPIIAKANSVIDNGFESIIDGEGEWVVSEIASSDTTNAIQLTLCNGGDQPTASFISESYSPGLHNVYINIKVDTSTSECYIRIDIDGKCGTQHLKTTGSLSLTNTIAPIRLNDVGFGYTAHKHTNSGSYISNLMVQTKGSAFMTKTIMMMRFGPDMALISDTEFPGFSFLSVGYSQPTTITTNQIYSEGGHIYAARSNGQIVKGTRPIWDNDFSFTYPDSVNNLNVSQTGESPIWTVDGLQTKGSTVKI